VRCDERDRDFATGQTHREIFDAATLGKKFRLSWEPEADFVHPRFVNRAGYDRIELTAPGQRDRFFQRGCGGARGFLRWLSWRATGILADNLAFSGPRNALGFQSEINNLGSDAGAIAKRDANARFPAHARDRNRIFT
jgi:hypothetical protein